MTYGRQAKRRSLQKRSVGFRLSLDARLTLRRESRRRGLTMTAILEQLIRQLPARESGVRSVSSSA